MVSSNKDRVGRRGTDASQGEDDSNSASSLNIVVGGGLNVVITGKAHASADGNKNQRCIPGDGLGEKDVVDDGGHWR